MKIDGRCFVSGALGVIFVAAVVGFFAAIGDIIYSNGRYSVISDCREHGQTSTTAP